LSGDIPAALLRVPGELTIGVSTPAPGGGDATGGTLTVRPPPPVLSGLSPAAASLAQLPIEVRATGSGFLPTSTVHIDGSPTGTTYVDSGTLVFSVGDAAVTALSLDNATPFGVTVAGTLEVTVVTPAPGGGASAAVAFEIGNPVPVIDSIDPSQARADQLPVTVTLTGSGFIPTSAVSFGDGRFVDATTIEITVPQGTAAGVHSVTVANAAPGGGNSNAADFTVTNAAPVLRSISPETALEGDVQTIGVSGENFVDGSEILLNGQALTTRFNGTTSLSGSVFGLLVAGTYEITVSSPGAPTSNGLSLTVLQAANPVPHITSITDPDTVDDGDTVTVTGTGFISTTDLSLDGRTLSVTRVSGTTLQFVVPSGGADDGSHTLTVTNPASTGGGGGSSTFSFTTGSTTVTSAQIIVFNDTNILDDEGMDDDFDSDSSSNPNNKKLVRNLVGFTGTGSHVSGTVVQFDCGRSSGFTHPCDSTNDFSTNTMKSEIVAAGFTVSVVNSSSGSITSIPSNVKVLFLWLPKVAFTGVEINALKQFASNGGRIVFVGEFPSFYGSSNITGVANPLLKDLGGKSTILTGSSFDSGFTKVGASSINTSPGHQVTTGLTGIEHAATAAMTVDSGDTVLWKDAAGSNNVAAAVKIDTSKQLPTAAPTLTSISPNPVVAGQSAVTMTLIGTNFTPSSGVTLSSGSSVFINSNGVTYVSSTKLEVSLNIGSGTNQAYTFQVTIFNGSSSTLGFTINTEKATVTSVSPTSGLQGSIVSVTITGTRFTGATAVNLSGGTGKGSVPSFTVDSDTQISAVLAISLDAGTRFISVTNAAGAANSVNFTVTASAIASATSLQTSVLAGSTTSGSTDATGTAARFSFPGGTWADGQGNLYVSDTNNHTIRKIVISSGVVTTLAGSGSQGSANGTGTAATFKFPEGLWGDGKGILYVADTGNHLIRKIVIASGVVTTLAGTGSATPFANGTGTSASFSSPHAIWGSLGNLYVADKDNHVIRKIVISSGVVTTIAGVAGSSGSTDATGTSAKFNLPLGITGDSTYLYVTEGGNHTIRRIQLSNQSVTTFAGVSGTSGSTDATGTSAKFNFPHSIWMDGTNLWVVDLSNNTIRKIVISSAVVTTVAGSAGLSGSTDGTGSAARFTSPQTIVGDGTNLYVSGGSNNQIRKLATPVVPAITTISPTSAKQGATAKVTITGTGFTGTSVNVSGTGVTVPSFTVDSSTQITATLVLAGGTGARNVTVTTGGGTSNTKTFTINSSPITAASSYEIKGFVGFGGAGFVDGTGTDAAFDSPNGVFSDGTNLYIADTDNDVIRKMVISTGVVTTLAGTAGISGSTDGTGAAARFDTPFGIWGDATGTNLYVTVKGGVRKVVISSGVVSTFAGSTSGATGFMDDTGTAARFNFASGIWGDVSGNLYVADQNNRRIRKVVISGGAVSTIAGSGSSGADDNATGTSATFNGPFGLTGDGTNLYVADRFNHTIRQIVISSTAVTTLAGSDGLTDTTNDTGIAARFSRPEGIWTDGTDLYVADNNNHSIRKIVISSGVVTTFAGLNGTAGHVDASGSSARFNDPHGIFGKGATSTL